MTDCMGGTSSLAGVTSIFSDRTVFSSVCASEKCALVMYNSGSFSTTVMNSKMVFTGGYVSSVDVSPSGLIPKCNVTAHSGGGI